MKNILKKNLQHGKCDMNKGSQHFCTRSSRMFFHFLITSVRVGNDSPEWQTGNIAIPLNIVDVQAAIFYFIYET